MMIASEHRRTKAGSRAEMLWATVPPALTVGDDEVIAQCLLLPQMQWTLWIITGRRIGFRLRLGRALDS